MKNSKKAVLSIFIVLLALFVAVISLWVAVRFIRNRRGRRMSL